MELTSTKYKQTEVGLIPEDWEVKSMREITTLMTNGFVGTATSHYSEEMDSVLYIQGYNVKENSFNFHGIKHVSLEFHKKNKKSSLLDGDLLTVQTGDVGLTTIVPKELEGSNCHALIISRFNKKIANPWYFAQYFNSKQGRSRLKELETGTTMKHINVGELVHWFVPLPPTLTEQKAIATALSDVDSLISSLDKLIIKKKAIKQGAMQELLTPPHQGGRRLPGFNGDWEEVVFTDICDLIHGHQFRTEDFNHNTEGIKVIKIGNVMPNKLITEGCDSISSDRLEDFEQYKFKEGDILMSLTGNIGRVVRLKEVTEHLLQNYRVGKFVPKSGVSSAYLSICLGSIKTTKQLEQLSNAGAQANFGKQDFNKVSIAIPSNINEQESIAQILSDMDKEIESLENKKTKYQEIKQGMMQELLTGKTRLIWN